jgi:cytidylate kinase
MAHRIVAIDGPAASGKTTLARRLADQFGLEFLDTGLLYRAVASRLLDRGLRFDDVVAAEAAARAITVAELDPAKLGTERISQGASKVAVIPAVRAALLELQRSLGRTGRGAVLVGRDIGTVVRPDATHKIFVTASVEERAMRRFKELQASGAAAIYEQVLEELCQRDARDKSRAVAPLVPASDAFILDSTNRDVDAAFEIARAIVAAAPRGHAGEAPEPR